MSNKARVPAQDFNTPSNAGNTSPSGIWSDGSTMWIADTDDAKLYAYSMSNKARVPAQDFNTLSRAAGNTSPSGIYSDGTNMWVADPLNDKLYTYDARLSININSLTSVLDRVSKIATGSDLSVTTLSASTNTVFPSETITLTATVRNTGEGASSTTTLRWYRSADSTIDINDTPVGTSALSSLGVGTSVIISNRITVPNTVGNYTYYYACVDPATNEYYTNNNCSSTVRIVVLVGLPLPTNDFNTLSAAGNNFPTGLWSDGTNMWVANDGIGDGNKIYAYNLATKAHVSASDFDTLRGVGNIDHQGLWSDHTTMWVADYKDHKIYAYNLATKAHVPAKDFNTLSSAGNTKPSGIWSDGRTMWVADWDDDKLYAYNLASKAHVPAKDFNTLAGAGNNDPRGLWSDGTTMWVADTGGDKLYAYKMSDKTRDSAKDFNTLSAAGNNMPNGIWSDGTTLWVADETDDKIYAYDAEYLVNPNSLSSVLTRVAEIATVPNLIVSMSASRTTLAPSDTITLTATVGNPGGDSSSATTLRWYRSTNSAISPADTQVGTNALSSLSVDTNVAISNTITVPNAPGTYYYYACVDSVMNELETNNNCSSAVRVVVILGHPLPTNDFNTLAGAMNTDPRGIWSDGMTMWVTENRFGGTHKIFAYDLATKARNANEDFNTLSAAGNTIPEGLWSDGTTMWIADWSDTKLYAYSMSNKAHVSSQDFNTLSDAGNARPKGLWSDGTTMWVADENVTKIFAYNLATKARNPNEDFDTLDAAGNDKPTGIWSDGTTMWVVDQSDDKIYAYDMMTKARVLAKDFNTLSAAGNNSPDGIWSDGTTMWVADYGDDKIFAYDARGLVNTN